ncbi:unnamed protein product [Chrysodeixis includens]|uniref:VMP25 protein n=1 Tax=Chrysodeixis includens TaxID=689277 RepID=A0A9P0C1Z4_CHRIL|nr:unnamed protein product [Chrysodeixis includens]
MHVTSAITFVTLAATCVTSYPHIWNGNHLAPVHGLYVKPSSNGITGDLFVAATEESGTKTQWAVDQPINYIPVTTATQPQAAAVAIPYTQNCQNSPDENSSQKRAVISNPVQYAYALPVPAGKQAENTPVAYAYPIAAATTETPKCEHGTAAHYPYQFPYQLFYPQVMTAYTNAMSILKDVGLSEDAASAVMAQATPTWPTSYAYPMYVMVDPNALNQNQPTTTAAPPTSTSSSPAEETTQPEAI